MYAAAVGVCVLFCLAYAAYANVSKRPSKSTASERAPLKEENQDVEMTKLKEAPKQKGVLDSFMCCSTPKKNPGAGASR
jgi:hypothetical protein